LDYEISRHSLRCRRCEKGYQLDLNYECTECESGYIFLPQDSSICREEILNCSEYELYDNKWICKQCNLGYEMECSYCVKYDSNLRCVAILETTDDISDTDFYDEEEEVTILKLRRN
jgi:hypothetical protein